MKYSSDEYRYPYHWKELVAGFWQRYPNPGAAHVLSEDVVSRSVAADGALHSRRILLKTNRAPAFAKRWISKPWTAIVEESVLDPRLQTLTTYSRNVTYTRVLCIEERCVYSAAPDARPETLLRREAWVSSSIRGFSTMIQQFGIKRFRNNIAKTNAGFMTALSRLYGAPHGTLPATIVAATPSTLATIIKPPKKLDRIVG